MRTTSFVLLILAAASVTFAQTPVIVSGPPQSIRLLPDQNLTQALEMIGCDANWLSVLVTENKIAVNQLGTLPFGNVYAVPAGVDCRTPAPPEVAALSKAMLTTRTATARAASLGNAVQTLEGEVETLKTELATAKASADRALTDGRAYADAKTSVEAQLQAMTQERDTLRTELAARWTAVSGFLFGLLVSTVVCIGAYLVRRLRGGAA